MLGIPRSARLFVLIVFIIVIPSLYILYPSQDRAHPPDVGYTEYEAGGIDSEHVRDPVKPDFDIEEVRWSPEEDTEAEFKARPEAPIPIPGEGAVQKAPEQGKYVSGGDRTAAELTGEEAGGSRLIPGEEGETGSGGIAAVVDEDAWLTGGVIMPKLANETAKAELGRAAWRVMHLMTLRYPENPTPEDRQALKTYFHLFSRLYPCGECADEFQKLLKQYPPQTGSRKSASLWLCHVHNMVNERLGKPEFDCLTLDETYDCGCGPEASAVADGAAAEEIGASGKNAKAAGRVLVSEDED